MATLVVDQLLILAVAWLSGQAMTHLTQRNWPQLQDQAWRLGVALLLLVVAQPLLQYLRNARILANIFDHELRFLDRFLAMNPVAARRVESGAMSDRLTGDLVTYRFATLSIISTPITLMLSAGAMWMLLRQDMIFGMIVLIIAAAMVVLGTWQATGYADARDELRTAQMSRNRQLMHIGQDHDHYFVW